MAYYTKVLQPNERVLAIGRLHWSIYGRAVLILLLAVALAIGAFWIPDPNWQRIAWLAAAAIAVLGLLAFLAASIRRHATEIVVTDKRVIYKRGVLSRYTVEMHTSKIETVDVDQGILGRLLGYGTVEVRGTGSGIEPLRYIGHPLEIRNAIIAV
ncbi:MAG TPA: PH domain-containing protein [Acetobacteraceae bacterium]|jgi:membrane protein YdbS with pleckstrin-like domain|nr:PH domain-containing protein [Acetobacteraceae bacterium]